MFGLTEARRGNICISDIPAGCSVEVWTSSGKTSGIVIKNYGGCIYVKSSPEKCVGIDNNEIKSIEIIGKESVDSFQIKCGKSDAEFKQLMGKIESTFGKKGE